MADLRKFLEKNLDQYIYLGTRGEIKYESIFERECQRLGVDFNKLLTCVEDNICERYDSGEYIKYNSVIDDYFEGEK